MRQDIKELLGLNYNKFIIKQVNEQWASNNDIWGIKKQRTKIKD